MYPHHVKTYGHPSTFGYKDFIPMWKAEKFDAGKLASFFKSIGAKYVVSMAVHHDNFDNWDSKYHRWNSVKMGPKKDIIGEWEKACRITSYNVCYTKLLRLVFGHIMANVIILARLFGLKARTPLTEFHWWQNATKAIM